MLKIWLEASRPKTLSAAVVPVWLGTGWCLARGISVSWLIFACTLLSALMIQVATNLFNDSIDATKGADQDRSKGPRRLTASGLVSPQQMMRLGLMTCVAALIFAVPLILHGGWPIVLVGVVSLLLAYGYTGGPYPLAYIGLGDVFVILFFGLIAVAGTVYLQVGNFIPSSLWIGLAVGATSTVLIVVNNTRDFKTDVKVSKKTLAVRFGPVFCWWETLFLDALALGVVIAIAKHPFHYLPLLVLPLMLNHLRAFRALIDEEITKQSQPQDVFPRWGALLAGAGRNHVLFGLLWGLSLLMPKWLWGVTL